MIKAIDTHYKGYKFRSRLEARWAVFFDALELQWEYEAEGYDLDGDWYLPDFHFPERKWFIEIKAKEASEHEECLMYNLIESINEETDNKNKTYKGYIFDNGIWLPGPKDQRFQFCVSPEATLNGRMDSGYEFCICTCGRVGIEFGGRIARICKGEHIRDDRISTRQHPRLIKAYKAALSARFEHGESP